MPPWYRPEEWKKRQSRGSNPRGPPRGGSERSADDPRRKPRGGQCGGTERSANETQTPPKTCRVETNGGTTKNGARDKRPTIITVEKNGHERKWGLLSRVNAWKAGCFIEDMDGDARIFLEKDGKREEVQAVKRVEGGREVMWLEAIAQPQPQPSQEPKGDDEPTQEEDPSKKLIQKKRVPSTQLGWRRGSRPWKRKRRRWRWPSKI